MSGCYGSKISGSQKTVVLQIWQKKKKKRKAKLTSLTFLCMIVTGMFPDSNIARLARVFWGERAPERARKPRT